MNEIETAKEKETIMKQHTMTVVTQHEFGAPDVLVIEDRPVPEPLPTEIRVRVAAAGVNPVDWKTRAGDGIAGLLGAPPIVLGWDVAGVVDAVGFGVTRFAVGDEVYGMPWFPREAGAYAEYVTAPSRHFAHRPLTISAEEAAALPMAALTAWQALVDTADIKPGQRVLVHAAAGGVGHLAAQIAKTRGAHVLGTARASKHQTLRELGVDEPIDYTDAPFEEVAREVDVVLDLVGGDYSTRSLATLRYGGLLIAVPAGASADLTAEATAQDRGLRVTGILVEPDYAALEQIGALVEAGRLRVILDRALPLEEVAKAHEIGENGRNLGKTVLTIEG
ncbi:MAG: NADP-dependent oxidoreductase [Pseudonocardiaceae bacterium]